MALARTYLTAQRQLWPEHATSGRLPEPSEEVLADYATAFRKAFLGEAVTAEPWDGSATEGDSATVYLRFSSENSNSRSLDQQLRLTLERARREGHWVSWADVFADSGVTGTTAGRTGYQLAKARMLGQTAPKALYVDDLSRLSRGVDPLLP